MRCTAAHSSSLRTHPDGNEGLPKKIARVRSETAASSASRSQRQPCGEGCSGTNRGTSPASRTRWSIPAYVGSGTITSSPGSVSASSASSMLSPSPEVITTSPSGSYRGPPRRAIMSATSRLSSLMPVNGSHEFASSVPTAARVAATATAGGGMSVSRFSMRSTSGSLPAAAATLSIENSGMPFSRSPIGSTLTGRRLSRIPVRSSSPPRAGPVGSLPLAQRVASALWPSLDGATSAFEAARSQAAGHLRLRSSAPAQNNCRHLVPGGSPCLSRRSRSQIATKQRSSCAGAICARSSAAWARLPIAASRSSRVASLGSTSCATEGLSGSRPTWIEPKPGRPRTPRVAHTVDDLVREGQQALARSDWGRAHELFEQALEHGEQADALDGLGRALHFGGDYARAIDLTERAFAAYRAEGRIEHAADCARWLAFLHGAVNANMAVAGGWMARAQSLLDGTEESAGHGWLLLDQAPFSDDARERERLAASALAIGRRFGDAELEFDAMALLGESYVAGGRVAQGMALLDQAM